MEEINMDEQKKKEAIGNKSSDYLYLEKLEFNPELRKTWLNFFVTNFRVVLLLMGLLTIWGVYSFLNLPRESNPEVKIPIAVVSTVYTGASPSDIEELVTKKLETGISGIKGINKITSSSRNSFSSVVVEFDAKEDLEDSIRKLRDQVKNIQKDLPEDASEPVVSEISFDDEPIMTFALTGPYDGFTLKSIADDIKDELEKIPGVREVNVYGGDEKEFEIAYDPQKLTFFNISADQANQVVKATNMAFPAGSFEGTEFTYPVRADARFFDVKKLGNLPISHSDNGAVIYLKDIAAVTEKAIDKTVYTRFSIKGDQPQEAVTISLVKKTGGNIVDTVNQAKSMLSEMSPSFPEGVKYDIIVDFADYIEKDFAQLTHDFILTISLVFGILFLIVGLKEAFVAGMAVPLVFFITFGVMNYVGITLNFLSIFSLILSLGLLVDDAIVVVSATKQYLRTGKFTPEEAVLLVLNDFKVVLTTTTLTTVWAFLPLLSASGIIGSFIKSIPVTVSVTLLSSLGVALLINHPLAAVLERVRLTRKFFYIILLTVLALSYGTLSLNTLEGYVLTGIIFISIFAMVRWYYRKGRSTMKENEKLMDLEWDDDDLIKDKLRDQGSSHDNSLSSRFVHGIVGFNSVLPYYEKYLCAIIKDKKKKTQVLLGVLGLFLLSILMPITGIVPSEFFPNSDSNLIFLNMRASTGLNLDETSKIIAMAEEKLLTHKEIANFSTAVGSSNSGSSLGGGVGSTNLANITINLVDSEERDIKSYELSEMIRKDLEGIKEAEFTVEAQKGGPPSGSAFEARISGDDLSELDRIANDLKSILVSVKGVVDADISLKDSPAEYTFTLDPVKMELYDLNASYVGSVLRMAISGTDVTKVLLDGKEIKVVAVYDENKLPSLESIQNLQILNLKKQPVFIKDVAKIELKPSVETITRVDQKRAVTLTANISSDVTSNAVLSEFKDKFAKEYKMPDGYEIFYGGENEQNTESVLSILRAMIFAALLIISTLVIQFNSFKEAMIVLVTIPLALIGVFLGMAIMRVNLSFPGLIGILALFGIVVKNAIILIDKINLNIKSGICFEDAIVDAGKSRLEAIFITSIATIFGIIPITFSNEMWRALGSAIIFGLMLSSFLTLFIVPILYSILLEKSHKRKLRNVGK